MMISAAFEAGFEGIEDRIAQLSFQLDKTLAEKECEISSFIDRLQDESLNFDEIPDEVHLESKFGIENVIESRLLEARENDQRGKDWLEKRICEGLQRAQENDLSLISLSPRKSKGRQYYEKKELRDIRNLRDVISQENDEVINELSESENLSLDLLTSYGPEKLLSAWCALSDESKNTASQNFNLKNIENNLRKAIRKNNKLEAQETLKICDDQKISNEMHQKYAAQSSKFSMEIGLVTSNLSEKRGKENVGKLNSIMASTSSKETRDNFCLLLNKIKLKNDGQTNEEISYKNNLKRLRDFLDASEVIEIEGTVESEKDLRLEDIRSTISRCEREIEKLSEILPAEESVLSRAFEFEPIENHLEDRSDFKSLVGLELNQDDSVSLDWSLIELFHQVDALPNFDFREMGAILEKFHFSKPESEQFFLEQKQRLTRKQDSTKRNHAFFRKMTHEMEESALVKILDAFQLKQI